MVKIKNELEFSLLKNVKMALYFVMMEIKIMRNKVVICIKSLNVIVWMYKIGK